MHRVLLYGPNTIPTDGAYGGGLGGYTRKMHLYLNWFKDPQFQMIPCYHTIRGQSKFEVLIIRLLKDVWSFVRSTVVVKPGIIHILAQYRTAIYREFLIVALSKIFGIPVIYEIKAGVFLSWFNSTDLLSKQLCKFCLHYSDIILCQGKSYVHFLDTKYSGKVFYHPNFVPSEEVPGIIGTKLNYPGIRVLFVGFQFKEKGVFELVDACKIASEHIPVELTLVGKEHPDFRMWLDKQEFPSTLKLNRVGELPHLELASYYQKNDVYCYPTYHSGEGHNNTINEAMMMGMVIVTTAHGFLSDILSSDSAYFLENVSSNTISKCLIKINDKRECAREKGLKARELLLNNYTSRIVLNRLKSHYKSLI